MIDNNIQIKTEKNEITVMREKNEIEGSGQAQSAPPSIPPKR